MEADCCTGNLTSLSEDKPLSDTVQLFDKCLFVKSVRVYVHMCTCVCVRSCLSCLDWLSPRMDYYNVSRDLVSAQHLALLCAPKLLTLLICYKHSLSHTHTWIHTCTLAALHSLMHTSVHQHEDSGGRCVWNSDRAFSHLNVSETERTLC